MLPPRSGYYSARFGQVAQLVEQRTENPCVGSSILPLATRPKALLSLTLSGYQLAARIKRHRCLWPNIWRCNNSITSLSAQFTSADLVPVRLPCNSFSIVDQRQTTPGTLWSKSSLARHTGLASICAANVRVTSSSWRSSHRMCWRMLFCKGRGAKPRRFFSAWTTSQEASY